MCTVRNQWCLPRGIKATFIVSGDRGQPHISFAFSMQATKAVASEQAYSSFVPTRFKSQLTTELNQTWLKASPEDTPYEGVTRRQNTLCKNLEVKEVGGHLLEGAMFSGTYSTSLVPRPHPLTRKRVWWLSWLCCQFWRSKCYSMQASQWNRATSEVCNHWLFNNWYR